MDRSGTDTQLQDGRNFHFWTGQDTSEEGRCYEYFYKVFRQFDVRGTSVVVKDEKETQIIVRTVYLSVYKQLTYLCTHHDTDLFIRCSKENQLHRVDI